jgi:hypothetical protein
VSLCLQWLPCVSMNQIKWCALRSTNKEMTSRQESFSHLPLEEASEEKVCIVFTLLLGSRRIGKVQLSMD